MTLGYRTDTIAVRALLNHDFAYIGLLGSISKTDKLIADLIAEGISKEKIKKIHAPIGMQIKSQTPEEIAISIAAEIIQIKNKNL
jgi:xanthine dehydrogenase accessory factor